jgi:hypothetical protein
MATTKTTYTNAELNALIAEFSQEFDTLVKAEATKMPALKKSDDGDSDDKAPPSKEGSESGSESAPPADASASAPPDAPPAPDASAASAPPAPDASAASAPADPAASAAGADPMQALVQAYGQLSDGELQQHFMALKQVLDAKMAASAGPAAGAPPAAAGAAPAGMAPPAPAGMAPPAPAPEASLPPAGPGAVSPLAGEGSQPVDPNATMALKSEFDSKLNELKKSSDKAIEEKDAEIARLNKSVEGLVESMTKFFGTPQRKGVTGKDIGAGLMKSEKPVVELSKSEITKKLTAAARNPKLEKKDRELINNFYKGTVSVDALSHLLA